jgi:predicted amidohydrolase
MSGGNVAGRELRVALTQMQPSLDIRRNLRIALELVREAGEREADLIVLPENALCIGSNQKMREAAIRLDGPELDALRAAAREVRAVVVLGGAKCLGSDGQIRNSAHVIDAQGEIAACYDKLHLFNATVAGTVFNASAVEQAGDHMQIVEVKGVKVGLSVCYDIRFPEMYRSLARAGAQVLLVPAAFTYTTGQAHWEVLVRSRAIENSAYLIASATIRGDHSAQEGFETWGHALAVDPWGAVLADLGTAQQAVQIVSLRMSEVERIRTSLPVLGGGRHDVYGQQPASAVISKGEGDA